jgi:hypothetical protein
MVPQGFQKGPFFGGTGQGATMFIGVCLKKGYWRMPQTHDLYERMNIVETFPESSTATCRYAITQSIVQKPKCCPAYASDFPAYQQLSCTIFYFGRETKLWV